MSHNYTYLELVNGVLVRLREDTVTSVNGQDDVVVELVKEFVNDAKEQVENMHTWTALSTEWDFSTVQGERKLTLTDSHKSCIIDYVYSGDGIKLEQASKEYIRKKSAAAGNTENTPRYWCLDGTDNATGDLRVLLYPTPKEAESYTAYGYQTSHRLVNDTDLLHIPGLPVIYMATALAARERGEVGGQSSGELLQLARSYISDAIAMDGTNSDLENIWTTV